MGTKKCSLCHETKPHSEFYGEAHRLLSRCKLCHRAWARTYKAAYRAAHPQPKKEPGFRHTAMSRVAYELWGNAVRRSIHRGLPSCDLTREWVEAAVRDFCAVNYHVLEARHPFRPSIDRIDKCKGYTKSNARIVWLIENLARNSFTDEQLEEFCKRKLGLI